MDAPRWLYLHGFASSEKSTKGLATERHFAERGIVVERLNLRLPSFEHLRVSAMLAHVRERIGGERDRAVLFGSSLGGLVAARTAEADARVCALVLMAPAFHLVDRWRARLGESEWEAWRERGWLEVDDWAERKKAKIDYGFVTDLDQVERHGASLPDVRVPTLIIHGRGDDVVDVEGSRGWARDKRHVHLVEVDDGHELTSSVPRILAESDRFLAPFTGV
jgi:pimeloyl-ACP methyl ester carboxylesterase